MNGDTRVSEGWDTRPTWRSSCLAHPGGSSWRRDSLWTVPELWNTHRARFPQLLGRRPERAAHNGPQAFFFFGDRSTAQKTSTMTLARQGG